VLLLIYVRVNMTYFEEKMMEDIHLCGSAALPSSGLPLG